MSQRTKTQRPPCLQVVGSDTIRLTRDARRQLQRVTARNGRVAQIPKNRDEAITAYLNALPDDVLMDLGKKWKQFCEASDSTKAETTN